MRGGSDAALRLGRLLAGCLVAGLVLAGAVVPVVGWAGLASNRANDAVRSVTAELARGEVPATTTVTDVAGNPIAHLYDQRRTPVASQDIAETVKRAIVAVEDRRFYSHHGVDWQGTVRAFLTNASSGQVDQGASTLTQQYVKNYLLLVVARDDAERQQATETTAARKLREIRIALALDRDLGKDEILTRYLNLVPFGNGAYGIEEAARTYFGTSARDLTVPQAALLAGMVQASSELDPYRNPDGARARRDTVLDAMVGTGVLDPAAAADARATPLGVLPQPAEPVNGCLGAGDRGFFCDYALAYLAGVGLDGDAVRRGGYTIRTTLDPVVQDNVKRAVAEQVPADLPDVAEVMNVVQPGQDSHRVLAMASSRDHGLTLPATVLPQPWSLVSTGAGSTFKVFTAAAAMEAGMGTSATLDTPAELALSGIGDSGGANGCPRERYCVTNFGYYPPQMSVPDALAQSPNTTFVALENSVGVRETIDMAVRLGMRTYAAPDSAAPGQSLVDSWSSPPLGSFTLGPVEVVPLEQANVAATLASHGRWCPPTPVDSVTDRTGAPVALREQACEQVVEPGLADTLADALSHDDEPGGTSAAAAAATGWTARAAGKTGTTEEEHSAAFLGFTGSLAGSTLVYGDSPTPRGICVDPLRACDNGDILGGTVPARTFYSALGPVLDRFGPADLPPPDPRFVDGDATLRVPDVSGLAAAEAGDRLQAAGFRSVRTSVASTAASGTVLSQSVTGPSAPGATVTLKVSSGVPVRTEPRTTAPPAPLPPPPPPVVAPSAPTYTPGPPPTPTQYVPGPAAPVVTIPPLLPGLPGR